MTDGTHQTPKFVASGVPFLVISNVVTGKLDWGSVHKWVTEKTYEECTGRCRPERGDVLYTAVGSYGVALVVDADVRFMFQRHIAHIKPDSRMMDPSFLAASLNGPALRRRADAVARGVAQKTVTLGELKDFPIGLPPLNEQRRIVAKLEALQARSRRARAALDAVPPLLEKLRQSILAAAFRGDLTKDWRAKHKNVEPAEELLARIRVERRKKWEETELAKMTAKGKAPKDDAWKAKYKEPEPVDTAGLPGLPEGWCWAALADVMLSLDQGWSPQCESAARGSIEEWAVMKTTAVQHNRFDGSQNKRLPPGLPPRPETELRVGDLLITRAGPRVRAGVCCRIDKVSPRLMACDKVYRFCVNESFVLGECIELILNSPRALAEIENMKTGISESGVNLTQDKFTALPIPIPPLEEQRALVRRAQAAVRKCDIFLALQSNLVASEAGLGRAILAKAFRGELVPQDPNDEPAQTTLNEGAPEASVKRTAKKRAARA